MSEPIKPSERIPDSQQTADYMAEIAAYRRVAVMSYDDKLTAIAINKALNLNNRNKESLLRICGIISAGKLLTDQKLNLDEKFREIFKFFTEDGIDFAAYFLAVSFLSSWRSFSEIIRVTFVKDNCQKYPFLPSLALEYHWSDANLKDILVLVKPSPDSLPKVCSAIKEGKVSLYADFDEIFKKFTEAKINNAEIQLGTAFFQAPAGIYKENASAFIKIAGKFPELVIYILDQPLTKEGFREIIPNLQTDEETFQKLLKLIEEYKIEDYADLCTVFDKFTDDSQEQEKAKRYAKEFSDKLYSAQSQYHITKLIEFQTTYGPKFPEVIKDNVFRLPLTKDEINNIIAYLPESETDWMWQVYRTK